MKHLYQQIITKKNQGQKSLAVLIDPDEDLHALPDLIAKCEACKVDYIFIGGSLLVSDSLDVLVGTVKKLCNIPVVLFPGNHQHISLNADALLFLSLISGRNPDFLIGQQILAAPSVKRSGLEVLPTGYMLVDCGPQTTVSYISNTNPIPYNKPSIAACTAMAGELLGLKTIFLDGGSGAERPVPKEIIMAVRSSVDLPIFCGGGIRSGVHVAAAVEAGADVIVVGNSIQKEPDLIYELSSPIIRANNILL